MTHDQTTEHLSVLLTEAIKYLEVISNHWYIDATFGRGGHTTEILRNGGKVLALDWDEEAITAGTSKFAEEISQGKLILVRESFSKLKQVIAEQKLLDISGILFDFGTSTNQLMSGDRGFSFAEDGELDMRMDTRLGVQAKDLLAVIPEKQLATLFWEYGGEEDGKRIAKAIKSSKQPITRTLQLSQLIATIKRGRHGKLHPATKVFQALRIAVNSELDEITQVLPQALQVVQPKGNVVTISFHEGEDRAVKTAFTHWEAQQLGRLLTDKPVTAGPEELERNPRARSAKLRAFKKN